jgi:hypothetical protein
MSLIIFPSTLLTRSAQNCTEMCLVQTGADKSEVTFIIVTIIM